MLYTFYSYKGGVGRSMAAANIAECFHARGLKVIIIDWDLEAPGIEIFFSPSQEAADRAAGLNVDAISARLGLIDLLEAYRALRLQLPVPRAPLPAAEARAPLLRSFAELAETPEAGTADHSYEPPELPEEHSATAEPASLLALLDRVLLPKLDDYLTDVHLPESSGGGLRLLTAGARSEAKFKEYVRVVQQFDWRAFYAAFDGEVFFDWLRERLGRLADVVIVDSRTGVTEMGGVCARQLADVVVSFCAPNQQNIDGVARMTRSFKSEELLTARGRRGVETVVVPTRIDVSESLRLTRFKADFNLRIEKQPDLVPAISRYAEAPFWELFIPYIPAFAYQERRVVGPGADLDSDPTKQLSRAYWRLATYLAALAPSGDVLRQRFEKDFNNLGLSANRQVCIVTIMGEEGSAAAAALAQTIETPELHVLPTISGKSLDDAGRELIVACDHLAVIITGESSGDVFMRQAVRYARQVGRSVHPVIPPNGKDALPAWLRGLSVLDLAARDALLVAFLEPNRARRLPFTAPPPPTRLVPRPGLIGVLQSVLRPGSCVHLTGPAGSGKTALALQLCDEDETRATFTGGIVWLGASARADNGTPLRALQVALQAVLQADTGGADADAERALRHRLDEAPLLLVLDDVAEGEDLAKLLDVNRRGAVLVVSRRHLSIGSPNDQVVAVPPMTSEEGADLLARLLGPPAVADAAVPTLALASDQLDGWPLALGVLGRVMAEPRVGSTGSGSLLGSRPIDLVAGDRTYRRIVRAWLGELTARERERLSQLARMLADQPFGLGGAATAWDLDPQAAGALVDKFQALALVCADNDGYVFRPVVYALLREAPGREGGKRHLSSAADRRDNEDAKQAGRILAGRELATLDRLTALAAQLESQRYYDLARRLYGQARAMPEAKADARRLAERLARCTYKDPELPAHERFDAAMAILESPGLGDSAGQESLGIAGAIAKDRWLVEGQRQHLEQARAFYLRGYQAGIQNDDGYTAINVAFVLDVIASLQEPEGETANAAANRDQARRIRGEIVEILVPGATAQVEARAHDKWWLTVTIAEAYFGLRQFGSARAWLRTALDQEAAEWQYEATAQQLAALARLQEGSAPGETDARKAPAWATLASFLGENANALRGLDLGKVGLALSGGGFRAALYHIGVLARLAELDVLRHIEVISCVSGGSIIGAHYYLELRKLLQEKDDLEITREDYIAIIHRIEIEFLRGVQRNIRTRLALRPGVGLRTAFIPHASLTEHLGELYESEIFARVADDGKRMLNELIVQPKGEPEDFAPKFDNWRRAAKVPILILNATTLNTGHNWQFTATWMGEPPARTASGVDANERLRRLYYWQAPVPHDRIRLGQAVAASSSVPGLFDPLELSGLYEGRTIQLADGGIHDNQGIAGLLEQECATVLVSDASGQMPSVPRPGKELLDVPLRANSILMARVREAEHAELAARQRSSLIRGFLFVHLRKGLDAAPVDWERIAPEDRLSRDATTGSGTQRTEYGVDKEIQRRLATIRTDLDSFSDQEAQALMLSGYLMTSHELPLALPVFNPPVQQPEPEPTHWRFLALSEAVKNVSGGGAATIELARLLDVARHIGFKTWRLSRLLTGLLWVTASVTVALAIYAFVLHGSELRPILLYGSLRLVVLTILFLVVYLTWPRLVLGKSMTQFVTGLAIALVGWLAAGVHLATTDQLYLRWGRTPLVARERTGR